MVRSNIPSSLTIRDEAMLASVVEGSVTAGKVIVPEAGTPPLIDAIAITALEVGTLEVGGEAFDPDVLADAQAALSLPSSTTADTGVLAIPVTHQVVVKATGGPEDLTLADGIPGQILTIILGTDDGDGTLTPTTKTGFATIVFADAGDSATLRWVPTAGWVIVGLSGVTAPPVITV